MKLIIINGPCGVGKTTAAISLHESRPLSYLLDVDAVGRNISHYRDYREERWELRDTVAAATVGAVLKIGRDVILEKMMFWPDLVDDYYKIARKHKAEIYEIILWAPKEVVMKRAKKRGFRKNSLLTPKKCESLWEEIDAYKEKRPNAIIIDTSKLSPKQVLNKIKKEVGV